jgi:hypothetical protein
VFRSNQMIQPQRIIALILRTRTCQMSQMVAAAGWRAARKFRVALS